MALLPRPTISASQVRAIQAPQEGRRGGLEQAKAVQAKTYQVFGRVEFVGPGEATFEANFPVWFTEIPQLSFGGELGGNAVLEAGNYPTISVMVRVWRTVARYNAIFYAGAEFILVTGGGADLRGVAHWQCEGTGLTNPLIGSEGSLEGTL